MRVSIRGGRYFWCLLFHLVFFLFIHWNFCSHAIFFVYKMRLAVFLMSKKKFCPDAYAYKEKLNEFVQKKKRKQQNVLIRTFEMTHFQLFNRYEKKM